MTGGSSLSEIATQKGVSQSDLVTALGQGAPQGLKDSPGFSDMMTSLAQASGPTAVRGPAAPVGPPPNGLVGGVSPESGRPWPGRPDSGTSVGALTPDQASTLNTIAGLLRVDPDELLSTLRSGSSLGAAVQAHGSTLSEVSSAVRSAMAANGTGTVGGFQVDALA